MSFKAPPGIKKPGFTIAEILGISSEDDSSAPGLQLSSSTPSATSNIQKAPRSFSDILGDRGIINPVQQADFPLVFSASPPENQATLSEAVKLHSTWFKVGDRYESTGLPAWTSENASEMKSIYKKHIAMRVTLMKIRREPTMLTESSPGYKERYEAALENAKATAARWDKNISLNCLFNPDPKRNRIPQFVRFPTNSYNHYKYYQLRNGANKKTIGSAWKAIVKAEGAEYWKWTKIASDLADEHFKQSELGFIAVMTRSVMNLKENADKVKKRKI